MLKQEIIIKVRHLLKAYQDGLLGDTTMPEDTHPVFTSREEKLCYYTLPMALNYQRNSYKLWEAAKNTWEDPETRPVFDLSKTAVIDVLELRELLLKHKLALQPNIHTATWFKISGTIYNNWDSFTKLFEECDHDFALLRETVQQKHKKDFPYLSGPKIFNYWSYIMTRYGDEPLKNRNLIEIAPDTHIIQASVKLGVIDKLEAEKISRETLSLKWRELLEGTGIDPIDVHPPLWFWSRSKFLYKI
jgi:hypothetical protein